MTLGILCGEWVVVKTTIRHIGVKGKHLLRALGRLNANRL